ncbi:hypothetical protein STOPSMEL_1 [Sinorhizobium phage StopSmel]|nr:hypothetical protein STOPSMEL_1 [Sinorhizobium phage StopSmel]
MKGIWRIRKYDSLEEVGAWELPGHYLQHEIERMLEALACRDLTEQEVINSLRRRNDPARLPFLDRKGRPALQCGENPWYAATFEKA